MKFNYKFGIDLSSFAFDTSFPLREKKVEGFANEEGEGTK